MSANFALLHYPAIDSASVDRLRSKYDPQFNLIGPHITIVFPLVDTIAEDALFDHIEATLSHWSPFPIRLNGLQKSDDGYLFLILQDGKSEVIRLHNEMYRGILAHYRRNPESFVPHLTLGAFGRESSKYFEALKEAEQLNLDYVCLLDRVNLVKVNEERTQIVWERRFWL